MLFFSSAMEPLPLTISIYYQLSIKNVVQQFVYFCSVPQFINFFMLPLSMLLWMTEWQHKFLIKIHFLFLFTAIFCLTMFNFQIEFIEAFVERKCCTLMNIPFRRCIMLHMKRMKFQLTHVVQFYL